MVSIPFLGWTREICISDAVLNITTKVHKLICPGACFSFCSPDFIWYLLKLKYAVKLACYYLLIESREQVIRMWLCKWMVNLLRARSNGGKSFMCKSAWIRNVFLWSSFYHSHSPSLFPYLPFLVLPLGDEINSIELYGPLVCCITFAWFCFR